VQPASSDSNVRRTKSASGFSLEEAVRLEASASGHRSRKGPSVRTALMGVLAVLLLSVLLVADPYSRVQVSHADGPPAVPLVTCNPYFSIWSFTDRLAASDTRHWTGTRQALTSLIRIDGHPFRLMGASPSALAALPQIGLEVSPTHTRYEFAGAGVHVSLTFLIPKLPAHLQVFSWPVAYLIWKVHAVDNRTHQVSIYYDNTAELVVNTPDEPVTWSHSQLGNLAVMRMGTQAQPILAKSGDNLRIDWGYLYIAVPRTRNTHEVVQQRTMVQSSFVQGQPQPTQYDPRVPRPASDRMPAETVEFDLPSVGPRWIERHVILAYDQIYSIELLGERQRPYWRRDGAQASDLLRDAETRYPELKLECAKFDRDFNRDMTRTGGEAYAYLAALSYRQALGANELAASTEGQPLFFPKEDFSDGSISTPDVIHPECPILLVFNPELLRASLLPIFVYVQSGRWRFPFAPAQLGTYPLANGQTYGGGETSEKDQQPVEETGNMLIMTAALAQIEKSPDLADKYWPVLTRWAQYLKDNGLDPKKQLCTDDFAGPMAHNTNLSVKAIEGLGAYSLLCEMRGNKQEAASYRQTAEEYAHRWLSMARDGDHFRLAFDQPGTWGQKYNLVWDRILGLDLFPPSVARLEVAYYKRKLLKFGFPLDSRNTYTKLDWEAWSASLTESLSDFHTLMAPLYEYVDQTPSRVPLADWYYTTNGKQVTYRDKQGEVIGFQARPVVGGIFMRVLMDPAVWKRWSSSALRTR
jgi:hypothetical protein